MLYQFIYAFLFIISAPVWFICVLTIPRWRRGFFMRLGFVPRSEKCVLFYGPSVGEAFSAARLAGALKEDFAHVPFIGASMTPEGVKVFKKFRDIFSDAVIFPLDFYPFSALWLSRIKPRAVIIVEGELWPVFLRICASKNIPVMVVAGRAGRGRQRALLFLKRLISAGRSAIDRVLLFSEKYRFYYEELLDDSGKIRLGGTLKMRSKIKPSSEKRFETLWISVHPGEFKVAEEFFRRWKRGLHAVAPRYVDTAEELKNILRKGGRMAVLLSEGKKDDFEVLVIDTMGELHRYIPLARVAVVGGSFIPRGGHNVYEPLSADVPVITGPHFWNYSEEVKRGEKEGCVKVVSDVNELMEAVDKMMREEVRVNCSWIEDMDGFERTLNEVKDFLRRKIC